MPYYRKRTRKAAVYQYSQKRPIDKNLISARIDESSDQESRAIYTATFPATMTGLRWNGAIMMTNANSGSPAQELDWAIVINRQGLVPDTMEFPAIPGVATWYQPEQNVLAFGKELVNFETGSYKIQGETKTMRKLQGGDQLMLLTRWGTAAFTARFAMIIQFFMKS